MQKLLSIGPNEILSGVNPSFFNQRGGLWNIGSTFNAFLAPTSGSGYTGVMSPVPAATDISGAVVVDTPIGGVVDTSGSSSNLYMIGDAGHFYKVDLSGDNNPTDLKSSSQISNPREGMEVFQARGEAQRYLYYFQNTQIGRFDLSSTFVDNHFTGLTNAPHVTHKFFDRVYYTNGSKIGYIYDNGASAAANDVNILDFEDDYTATTLSDDGQYLVIGISKNVTGIASDSQTKVLFWDTNQSSWQREWNIPAFDILAIRNVDGVQHAITSMGEFAFTFNSAPQKMMPLEGSSNGATVHNATDVLNSAIIWGISGRINSYGKLAHAVPTAFHRPFGNFSGSAKLVMANAKQQRIFVGAGDKLYRIATGTASTDAYVARTIAINLQAKYTISKMDFYFAEPLASGDQINVLLAESPDSSLTTFGSTNEISYTNKGAVRTASISSNKDVESVIIEITSTGAQIKQIDVWGTQNNI